MDNEFDFIKEASHGVERKPSDRVWSSVERKLYRDKAKKKLNIYKFLSIAAVLVGILASLFVVQIYTQQDNPQLFTYQENDDIRPVIIESLEDSNDPIYDVALTNQLYASYQKQKTFFDFESDVSDIKSNRID